MTNSAEAGQETTTGASNLVKDPVCGESTAGYGECQSPVVLDEQDLPVVPGLMDQGPRGVIGERNRPGVIDGEQVAGQVRIVARESSDHAVGLDTTAGVLDPPRDLAGADPLGKVEGVDHVQRGG